MLIGRVARWYIFIPNSPTLVYFGRPMELKKIVNFYNQLVCTYTLWSFALSYDNFGIHRYVMVFCYIFPILVYSFENNLATLILV
jgi:hypothetical protein